MDSGFCKGSFQSHPGAERVSRLRKSKHPSVCLSLLVLVNAMSWPVFFSLTPENKQLYDGMDTVSVSNEHPMLRDRPEKLARRLAYLLLERRGEQVADPPRYDHFHWMPLRPDPSLRK